MLNLSLELLAQLYIQNLQSHFHHQHRIQSFLYKKLQKEYMELGNQVLNHIHQQLPLIFHFFLFCCHYLKNIDYNLILKMMILFIHQYLLLNDHNPTHGHKMHLNQTSYFHHLKTFFFQTQD